MTTSSIIGRAKVNAHALATDLCNAAVMSGGMAQDWYSTRDRFAGLIEECGDVVDVILDGDELALMFADGTLYRDPGKHAYRMIDGAAEAVADTCSEQIVEPVVAPTSHNGRVAYIVEVSRSPAGRAASAIVLRVEGLDVLAHGAVRYTTARVGDTQRFRGASAVSDATTAAHSLATADAATQGAERVYIVGFGGTVAEVVRRWQSFATRHGMPADTVAGPVSILSQRYITRRDRMAQAVQTFAAAPLDALCWAQNPETYATCGMLVPGPDGPETYRRGATLPPLAKPRRRRVKGPKRALSANRPALTYQIAMAAAHDAGNRSMRAGGREAWSEDDHTAACDEFARLAPSIVGSVTAPVNNRILTPMI